MRWAAKFVLGLAVCASAACGDAGSPSGSNSAIALAAKKKPPPATSQALGANLNTIDYWDGSRPFLNLIYGSDWAMQATGGWEDVPAANLDANGWIKALPAGYHAERNLSAPANSADIRCRWDGNDHGSMVVQGAMVSNFTRVGSNQVQFRYAGGYPATAWAALSFTVDPADYVRNIDCRETTASSTDVFDPALISLAQGFGTIRFMKWQPAVEANRPVTWAARNKPGSGSYLSKDGVPVELMVAFSNQVGADPWFCMPWNADDDYVTRFAAYVRDSLAAGRRVYVEVSNEVWNGSYPVAQQAQSEGIAEGLDASHGAYGQALERYAEKTQHVMQIWSKAFAGQTSRLVRVAAGQHVSPFWTDLILGYRNTSQSVDALATAPYWALHQSDYTGQSLDEIMNTYLPAQIAASMNWAVQQKAVAQRYGKRFIAYEGGQDVVLPNNKALVAQVERDPRMGSLFTSFINQWRDASGDTLTLFALWGPIDSAGYGLVEYPQQPLSAAPKMTAVRASMAN